MASLTREQINKVTDIKRIKVFVKDWEGDVYLQQFTGQEQEDWAKACQNKDGKFNEENARARMLAAALVDEEGNKLYTYDQVHELNQRSAKVLIMLVDKINELNNVTKEDLEALAKN